MNINDTTAENIIAEKSKIEDIIYNCKLLLCENPNGPYSENTAAFLLMAKQYHEKLLKMLPF
jgi:hypothetical protein